MVQSAKVIDVTRSYVPVDPNTFPENLHATMREDYPEGRVPVVPYMGQNFLPTSYGYRSYFGTNSHLGISTLSPNKVDRLFMFQTLDYKNVLIALCDTGIWIKDSTATGDWIQSVTYGTPGATDFYEWYAVIITNKLYVYRNNSATFWKIETDPLSTPAIKFTELTPDFITGVNQLGMSRIGSRICFWDAQNAIAWSSPDDYTSFTPAILTGANVTTFNSIQGRIAAIRPHGAHSIAYASKSITLLQVDPGSTFLVSAKPILTSSGIAYQRQAVTANPDTIHYAFTDTGIFKIENAQADQVVPEFYDYLKPYNLNPVYLKMLQGRYLCFEMLDANAINGNAIYSKDYIGPASLVFDPPPPSFDEINASTPASVNECSVMAGITAGAISDIQAAANAATNGLRKAGTDAKAIYTCHLSMANGPATPIVWGPTPCGGQTDINTGATLNPAPSSDAGTIGKLTTDSSNKTTKTGTDMWTDGTWTMERFVQMQTAIWNAQQENIAGFMAELKGFVQFAYKYETNVSGCVVDNSAAVDCLIGRYPTAFSAPQFGYNLCSFWLTRYATSAEDVYNEYRKTVACDSTSSIVVQPTEFWADLYPHQTSLAAAIASVGPNLGFTWYDYPTSTANGTTSTATSMIGYISFTGGGTRYVECSWQSSSPDKVLTQQAVNYRNYATVAETYKAGYADRNTTQSSHNYGVPVAALPPTPETAYCEITGYAYTDTNGNPAVLPVGAGCALTADKYPGSNAATRVVPLADQRPNLLNPDGSICGLPFPSAADQNGNPVVWTGSTIDYPPVTFMVQQGSIAPKYPTIYGAFVYDTALKKWGKLKCEYKQLLDYSPMNSGVPASASFSTFGILAGLLKADGYVYLFDNQPADSSITWGKIGYYRLGVTDPEEVRIDFASNSSGTLTIDTSLEGDALTTGLTTSQAFSGRSVTMYPEYSGKWHNVTLTGQYDVVYMEFKGLQKGRR